MHFTGLIIGLCSFLLTGLFHPLVIKGQYHFTSRIWPLFLLAGIIFSAFSLISGNIILSSLLGIAGFTCFWSIHELKKQDERVEKGWFPGNPKHNSK